MSKPTLDEIMTEYVAARLEHVGDGTHRAVHAEYRQQFKAFMLDLLGPEPDGEARKLWAELRQRVGAI